MGMPRYFFILLFIFVLLNGICFAQFSKKVDSLLKVCNTASSDKEKVTAYAQLEELIALVLNPPIAGTSLKMVSAGGCDFNYF